MKRAAATALLAMALGAGCFDTINGIPDRNPSPPPPQGTPVRCDAGLVPVEQPAPNIPKCEPGGDAGID